MSVPRYESCRDSGVEWNPEVPSHWTDTRLRFVARLNPSKSEVASRDRQDDVSFVAMDAVGEDGSVRLDQTRPIGEVETGYTYFADGDVTLAKITPCFENGKGAVMRGLLGGIGFGTTELIVARPRAGNSADFLHWLFTSSAFRKLGEGAMYGAGGQKRVPDDFVRDFPVALPPHSEQTVIAAFLDRETGKIDALVEAQRRLIELLKEKQKAVISHAVTKGLDPAAPMKHSGVEWLGEVPAHWEVKALKRVTETCCDGPFGSGLKSAHYVDEGVRVIRLQNIKETGYDAGDAAFIDPTYFESELSRHAVQNGDVLIAGLGDDRNLVGRACVAPDGIEPAMVKADCFRFRLRIETEPKFISHQLNAGAAYASGKLATGSTRSRIPLSTMMDRLVAVPPAAEQRDIARHLDQALAAFDQLVLQATTAVTLLQERRAALISAAVAGKIDVRGLAPELTEAA